ncbi:sugar phosphate isomerase [Nibricoccus aquaticus]|uniref:Sugar phosphate isomerase n=2 Tax=Nibricoccus aquaticus TaxID=2576891 RepID=A0A290QKG5_9BACT|nr:sugar phosphate isomerase [Nibricoccus aquaticus]
MIDLPAMLDGSFASFGDFATSIATAMVPIVSFDTSLRLADSTSADREAFLQYAPWAEAAGTRWLRVFDGGKTADAPTLHSMAKTVAWWRTERQKRGWRVDMIVETHDSLLKASAMRDFLTLVPDTALLWDSHHTWRQGKEDPLVTWRACSSHIVHIHVKDSLDQPSGDRPFTYVLPGAGSFPMKPLRETRDREFDGVVSLEWERLWHPYLPPLEDALVAASHCRWW